MKYKITNISNTDLIIIFTDFLNEEEILNSVILGPQEHVFAEPVMNGFLEKQLQLNLITIEEESEE